MDTQKTGELIAALRHSRQITQKQLADMLHISDRTISKWERGLGLPDVSLLASLADIFNINVEALLTGEIIANNPTGGNMKNTKYYICPTCAALTVSAGNAQITCCGQKLAPLSAQKATPDDQLSVETIDDGLYITANHPMTKEHYISFVALVGSQQLQIIRQYPEWDLQVHLPRRAHGTLLWYCTQHGLFYQYL